MRKTTDTFIIQIKGSLFSVVIDTSKKLKDPEVVKLVLNSHIEKIKVNDLNKGKTVEIALCDEGGTTIYHPEVTEKKNALFDSVKGEENAEL